MLTELLITIHDQDLLLECEASGQFAGLPHVYGFVGPRPVDKVSDDVRMIVARDHTPNYEHYPQFYDFTLWWTVTHHGLLEVDRVICVQYDMLIPDSTIVEQVNTLLNNNRTSMVAFTAGHKLADNWMLLIPGFEDEYRRGVEMLNVDMDTWPFFNEWPCTQGTAWRYPDFVRFMDWIEPLFDTWPDNVWAGHLMERMVKPWTLRDGRPEAYLGGVMIHQARDCHGTCALMGGNTAAYLERSSTFGRML